MSSPQRVHRSPAIPAASEILVLLRESYELAQDLRVEPWQFATSIESLREIGVSENVVRWLIQSGYVQHAIERTKPCDVKRRFARTKNLGLPCGSCFILSPNGIALANKRSLQNVPPKISQASELPRPHWDEALHTLFWQGHALKHFKLEAPNQEAILNTFETNQWPATVPIHLPVDDGINPKDRLHDTIKNLNRSVRPYLLFGQEGSGSRVYWRAQ